MTYFLQGARCSHHRASPGFTKTAPLIEGLFALRYMYNQIAPQNGVLLWFLEHRIDLPRFGVAFERLHGDCVSAKADK